MNEIEEYDYSESDHDWSRHTDDLEVIKTSSWLAGWLQRFTGKTSYSAVFHRMAYSISITKLESYAQVKKLMALKDSVKRLSGGYYTKAGKVAAFLGGHGDVPKSVEALSRSIDAQLLRLFTGSTLQANEITPDARHLAHTIFEGLSNTRATKANLLDFETYLRQRLPLNFRKDGKDFYQKFAELGFPLAQYRYGEICHQRGNDLEARRWYELAAKQGMTKAIKQLQQASYRDISTTIPHREPPRTALEILTGLVGEEDTLQKGADLLLQVDPGECAELKVLRRRLDNMQQARMTYEQMASYVVASLYLYGTGIEKDANKAINFAKQSGVIRFCAGESAIEDHGTLNPEEAYSMVSAIMGIRANSPTPSQVLQAVQIATLFDSSIHLWALNDATYYEYIAKVIHALAETGSRQEELFREILVCTTKLILNVVEPTQDDLNMILALRRHFKDLQRPSGPGSVAWRAKTH